MWVYLLYRLCLLAAFLETRTFNALHMFLNPQISWHLGWCITSP
jgi:hypothetical protein